MSSFSREEAYPANMLTWVFPAASCVSRPKALVHFGYSAGVFQHSDVGTSLKQIRGQAPQGGGELLGRPWEKGGLGGSGVSTSGRNRRQKGSLRHSSAVSYPTLLLTEVPPKKLLGFQDPGSGRATSHSLRHLRTFFREKRKCKPKNVEILFLIKRVNSKDFPIVQWLRHKAPKTGGLGSIPGQGTRLCMPQLKGSKCYN